jgi:hypothetical protein
MHLFNCLIERVTSKNIWDPGSIQSKQNTCLPWSLKLVIFQPVRRRLLANTLKNNQMTSGRAKSQESVTVAPSIGRLSNPLAAAKANKQLALWRMHVRNATLLKFTVALSRVGRRYILAAVVDRPKAWTCPTFSASWRRARASIRSASTRTPANFRYFHSSFLLLGGNISVLLIIWCLQMTKQVFESEPVAEKPVEIVEQEEDCDSDDEQNEQDFSSDESDFGNFFSHLWDFVDYVWIL